MALEYPAALWLLALVALLLLLARRHERRTRRVVSSFRLWRSIQPPDAMRARPSTRRVTPRTLLQAAVLLLLIAALSRPSFNTTAPQFGIVIDVSASMGAKSGERTRLDEAKARALDTLRTLPSSARVRLVSAGPAPTLIGVHRPGDQSLRDEITKLQAGAGIADLDAALATLETEAVPAAATYVYSDNPSISSWARDRGVHTSPIGGALDNLALTALAAKRLSDPRQVGVLATVRNYSTRAQETEVEVRTRDVVVGRSRFSLGAGESRSATWRLVDYSGPIDAKLLSSDALTVDDRRSAVVPAPRSVRVLTIGNVNRFIDSALRADAAVDVKPSGGSGQPLAPHDLIVCAECAGLPDGTAPVLWVQSGGEARDRPALVTVARAAHPVAAGVRIPPTMAPPATPLLPALDAETLVRVGDHPAILAGEDRGRRFVLLRAGIADSPLTLTVAFPILMSNAVRWLTRDGENATDLPAGRPLVWRLEGADAGIRVIGPDSKRLDAAIQTSTVSVVDTSKPGVYEVRGGGSVRYFVVNPAVETESDLRVAPEAPGSETSPATAARSATVLPLAWPLIVAALALALTEWMYRMRAGSIDRPAIVCRALVCTALAVALLGFRVRLGDENLFVTFVVDRSDSVSPAALGADIANVERMATDMRPGDSASLIVFGQNAAVERRMSSELSNLTVTSDVHSQGTNIERALMTALNGPTQESARRIVLVSDGRETSGSANAAAARAAAAGVAVDVLPSSSPSAARKPVAIAQVLAPSAVRSGEPYNVVVDLEGAPGAAGSVRIDPSGTTGVTLPFVLDDAGNGQVALQERREPAGIYDYEVRLDDDANATAGAVVVVSGRPRVLYVSDAIDSFAGVLRSAGWDVVVRTASAFSGSPGAVDAFDGVVLDDVPMNALSPLAAETLVRAVDESGTGLAVLGTARSLDPATTLATPLASALPIDLRPRAGKKGDSAAIVLVFDASGSMADDAGEVPKIELARQAVMNALDVVGPGDLTGVLAFSSEPQTVVALSSSHDRQAVSTRLAAVRASGSTAIGPAVETAVNWLRHPNAASVARRHILLVSDGRTAPADATRLKRAIDGSGIQVSVVALGADADRALLTSIAASTGGRALFPADVRELPRVLAREASSTASGWRVTETFVPRAVAHAAVGALVQTPLARFPGYVVGAPRATAEVPVRSHLDDPVLALWTMGLGRVMASTVDLRMAMGSAAERSNVQGLWTQALRHVLRSAEDPVLSLEHHWTATGLRLTVDAILQSGASIDQLDIRADVRGPDGRTQAIALQQTAPGRYEASVEVHQAGAFATHIRARDAAGTVDRRLLRGSYRTNVESKRTGVDHERLRAISDVSGGRVLDARARPFVDNRPVSRVELWPSLVILAILLFFFEAIGARLILRDVLAHARRKPSQAVSAA